ncbi:MAG: nucleotidyltransferase family protein, partial [Ruminococcus sp.]|nr:nucleotidyltransferase family protein [Ruminococcus sp.]
YHDAALGVFASATAIRAAFARGDVAGAMAAIPGAAWPWAMPDALHPMDDMLLYRLRGMPPGALAALPDVGEGLENRILSAAQTAKSMDELVGAAASPRYTRARIRRILACVLLDVTEELQSRRIAYLRPLGFSDEGAALLRGCTGEIVTSPAKSLRGDSEILPYLRRDILATDMAALAYEPPLRAGLDYITKIAKSNWIK